MVHFSKTLGVKPGNPSIKNTAANAAFTLGAEAPRKRPKAVNTVKHLRAAGPVGSSQASSSSSLPSFCVFWMFF